MKNTEKQIQRLIEFYHDQYVLIQELSELIHIDPENVSEIKSIIALIEYEHNSFFENNPELESLFDFRAHCERLKIILQNTSITIPRK